MSGGSDKTAKTDSQMKRHADGKSLRNTLPRAAQATWNPPSHRPDIVALLEESNRGRLPTLVPLRYSRMLQSPLGYLRGSAIVMADDLASLPTTKIRLQICGDCHLLNFGWFATPERNLIFDVNDFDETRRAPWEWDVKRLVTSVIVAAQALAASKSQQEELGQAVAREYRQNLARYAVLSPLEMWYVRLDQYAWLGSPNDIASKKRSEQMIEAARQRTLENLLPKLTERANGHLRFKDRPPLIFHPPDFKQYLQKINDLMAMYRKTLSDDRRELLDRYQLADAVYKVSGVGSVGLRCSIVLMLDPDDCPLILQIKEARASVLEKFVGLSERTHQGHRIVHGQRLMQAASDMFLGWANDSEGRSYYFRQLRDMKMSFDVVNLPFAELQEYAQLCGWALARAHAKAGDVSAIAGYLGRGDAFDKALAEFGIAYAVQVQRDFETLKAAAASGRIVAKSEKELTF